jgi:hypothetical protein
MKVFVYFNLHKKLFSVKALEGACRGRVIAHRTHLVLDDVTFKVSQAGRERVLREQRKNVHAGARGTWVPESGDRVADALYTLTELTYNPYKYSSFVDKYTEEPIHTAKWAVLENRKIFAQLT